MISRNVTTFCCNTLKKLIGGRVASLWLIFSSRLKKLFDIYQFYKKKTTLTIYLKTYEVFLHFKVSLLLISLNYWATPTLPSKVR